MEFIRVRALSGFTEFTPTGMIVLNGPKRDANGDIIKNGDAGLLPYDRAILRRDDGIIEFVDCVWESDASSVASTLVTDAPLAGTGEGVQIDGAELFHGAMSPIAGGAPLFLMTYKPFGKWEIIGPGLEDGHIFKGNKAAAQAYIDGLAEKYAAESASSDQADLPPI